MDFLIDLKSKEKTCAMALHELQAAGYWIVPKLTVSAGEKKNYTGYVFVKYGVSKK
jgi:hypothetical protein